MRFRILSFAVVVSMMFAAGASAQFGDEPAEVAVEPSPQSRPDELVRQLESTAGRGGDYRARAIGSLARIGAWPQVDRWLARLDAVADQAELARSAETIGTELLLRISLRSDMSDSSRSAIKKMTAAAKATQESTDRLQNAIAQLNTDDVDANLAANRTLLTAGDAAISEIVSAITAGVPTKQRNKLLGVLRSLGDGGTRSLDQLSLYGDPSVRSNALDALRAIDPQYAQDTLVSAAFAADASDAEVQIVAATRTVPADFEKLDAIAFLADRLNTLRGEASRTANDLSPVTLWSIDESRSGVTANRSTEIYQRYRDAFDAAQRLRRLGGLPPSVGRSVLAADLAYRLMVDVDWGTPPQLAEIHGAYPDADTPEVLLDALADARRKEDIPAAVGVLRLLADSALRYPHPQLYLSSAGGRSSELVDSVQDPQPRIRYEAAAIIAGLVSDHAGSFAGSSHFRHTLSEMASLDPQPTAILLETRPVVSLRQETILRELGYSVAKVTSAIEMEREIQRGGDLRLVVSKVMIADAATVELVDRIRRQPKGSRIPIVFYSDAETSERSIRQTEVETTSNRWISDNTPAVYLVALPGSPAALADVLTAVESKRRLPPLSIGDRARFRMIGTEALQGDSSPR